ncbi:MAG: hypothetical protein HON53_05040 [Planctomycetaceae bacterium]|jgi:hypothetical protein|nr:hypothetical protein [Planctomycetaceae bacterium]MBT6156900.1 hypothetical protein [Planctomycetaceae bacterium]
MTDQNRFLRRLKRQIKRDGNRKRRRYLKNVDAPPCDFNFGRDRTDVMNEATPGYANRQTGSVRD